ncbi:MAG: carbohydrate ABC transporter permease [Propionibacteriaceae bacterium]|jgi:putative aldouronate transport system permease protein|nr:carbohydrate ABC transporter permease [Propionibacteriaceae bacterium]
MSTHVTSTRRTTRIRSHRPSDIIFAAAVAILVAVILFVTIYPLWFVFIASFSQPALVAQGKVLFLPHGTNLFGYGQIFQDTRVWTGYKNTIIYTVVGTAVNMIVTMPAAYALSRPEFKARRPLIFLFAFTMFFSGGLIPTYLLYKNLNLLNTMWVFILPCALNVYNLIIARSFYEASIPEELHEAAVIDGANHFQYFWRVALPLSKAILSVIMLYYVVQHWNDFFTGLVFIRDYDKQPLQMVLRDILVRNQAFAGGAGTSGGTGQGYGALYADQIKYGVIIVASLPVIIIYPFIQKYFDKGVMIGAVKG